MAGTEYIFIDKMDDNEYEGIFKFIKCYTYNSC